MNAYNRRLEKIEAALGDLPMTVGEMSDAQLVRLIAGGDGTQYITDAELQRIINEPRRKNGRD